QARRLDLVGDVRGGHLEEGLAERLVTALRLVDRELVEVGRAEVFGEDVLWFFAVRAAELSHRPSSFELCLPACGEVAPHATEGRAPDGRLGPFVPRSADRSSPASGRSGTGGRGASSARTRTRLGTRPPRS